MPGPAIRFRLLAGAAAGLSGKPDSRAGNRAIELYDADKDGFLDAKELEKVPGLKAAMQQVDRNKDGKISADEIYARIQLWSDSKLGRMGFLASSTTTAGRWPGPR